MSDTKPIKSVNLRHLEIINRMVYLGQRPAEIARELGFDKDYIYVIVNSPLFKMELQKEVATKQHAIRESYFQRAATKGTKKLVQAVEKGKFIYPDREIELEGREIISIIQDVLDRTGHKPVDRVIEGHVDLGRMIIEAHQEAKESKEQENEESVIDIEVEECSQKDDTRIGNTAPASQ